MRQKWFRLGNSFIVTNTGDRSIAATVIGKAFRFRSTSVILDPRGGEMATVREVLLAIDRTTVILRGDQELARMQRLDPNSRKSVYVVDVKGESALRVADAGFMDFRIYRGDACVATSTKPTVGFLKQWDITMSDTEDRSLIFAICVAIDQNEAGRSD
jgi:uncharacterized protein YxjI